MQVARVSLLLVVIVMSTKAFATPSSWPDGRQAAVSLSWDDARDSQVPVGIPLLDKFGVKATFFVVPENVAKNVDGWKKAAASGHEIGNHTLTHPCTGNLDFALRNALEDFSLAKIQGEISSANERIQTMLGVTPAVFAYPCGNSWVGRGVDARSFIPFVASHFIVGRLWRNEGLNNPRIVDIAQAHSYEIDGVTFDELVPVLDEARRDGKWIIFAGHEINKNGAQTTKTATLERLLPYLKDPRQGFWLAPVGTVGKYLRDNPGQRQ
jgi:peptidoglycan/xylan/chitin deacetylase (PgdA/CDA1 family)